MPWCCEEKCCELLAYLGYDYYAPSVANKPPPLVSSKVSWLSDCSGIYPQILSPPRCFSQLQRWVGCGRNKSPHTLTTSDLKESPRCIKMIISSERVQQQQF